MAEEPRDIERNIVLTRQRLGRDVDDLTERMSPGTVVRRRTYRVRTSVRRLREQVMGSRDDGPYRSRSTSGSVKGTAVEAKDKVSDTLSRGTHAVADRTSDVADQVRRTSEGNPLAAGLVVFGLGWLAASVIPASRVERSAAESLTEAAREPAQAVAQRAKDLATETAQELREPASEAVEQVRSTATDAGQRVAGTAKSEARHATDRTHGEAQHG